MMDRGPDLVARDRATRLLGLVVAVALGLLLIAAAAAVGWAISTAAPCFRPPPSRPGRPAPVIAPPDAGRKFATHGAQQRG